MAEKKSVNKDMSRDELNEEAIEADVSEPEKLANKNEVIAAINAAQDGAGDEQQGTKNEETRNDELRAASVPVDPAAPDASETVEGGIYEVNGEIVDAKGEPVKDTK